MTVERLGKLKKPALIWLKNKNSQADMDEYFYVTAFDDKGYDEENEPEISASIMIGMIQGKPVANISTSPEELKKWRGKSTSVFAVHAKHVVITDAKQLIVRHLFDIEKFYD